MSEQAIQSNVSSVPVAATLEVLAEPYEVHRVNLDKFLRMQEGKFVGLDFIKKDGKFRKLNGRLGVQKHLKGGESTLKGDDKPYLVMYDVKTVGYRAVNLATVEKVRTKARTYSVIG